jgi:2-polyprenyl-6-methoxyphenol hydroxylase-like FAD-dependent oxidoreductase
MQMFVSVLIVGGGPGALAAAEIASGYRLASLVIGHESGKGPDPDIPVSLDARAVQALDHHGVLEVLRPYLYQAEPPTVSAHVFEDVLRQHCAADLNVTLYDTVELTTLTASSVDGGISSGCQAVLTSGRSRWDLSADALIDTSGYPANLSDVVNRAADDVDKVLALIQSGPA